MQRFHYKNLEKSVRFSRLCHCRPRPPRLLPAAVAVLLIPALAAAEVRIAENFKTGDAFRVGMRVQLEGTLVLPEKDGPGKKLQLQGESQIDYIERVLETNAAGSVTKTIRWFETMRFARKVAGQDQKSDLRPAVRRMVLLRHNQVEVPFCPDGPLTWDEIDMVRTDVFTPALTGLYPSRAVEVDDRWSAATSAIRELTDFERIDSGGVACRLERITTLSGHRHARVSFQGTVTGINEDGRARQELDGYFYFDLDDRCLSYLSMRGVHHLLDDKGNSQGRIEGRFVLTRQRTTPPRELSDAALTKLRLEPDATNTELLYESRLLGIRFRYPRNWRVAGGQGAQLGVDERSGSGVLLTLESLKTLPTGHQYQRESRAYLEKQRLRILRLEPVAVVSRYPYWIERFAFDIDTGKELFRMAYYTVRGSKGGAVLAGRIRYADRDRVERELRRIVDSLEFISRD